MNENEIAKYHLQYRNEAGFKKLERSVKKYNMLSYKKLYFSYYPLLKSGDFLGELEKSDETTKTYTLKLPTDMMFIKVHGYLKLKYTVDFSSKTVFLETIEPEKILIEGHQSELASYKGVMISKDNSEKDMFKVNLLNMINK